VMLLPAAKRRGPAFRFFRAQGGAGAESHRETTPDSGDSGSHCPRCKKPVERGAKACGQCGNILIPIRYAVEGGSEHH